VPAGDGLADALQRAFRLVGLLGRHPLTLLGALLACAALAPAASAGEAVSVPIPRPAVTWAPAVGNYTIAHRTPASIRWIVIHATEGPAFGAVSWFEDPRSHASSNYVVDRAGSITQLVPLSGIAWHTGNAFYNAHSVGIEHEGTTDDPAGFTRQEYVASARLAAWLCRRSLLPIDREHVIGHSEVPDPFHPGLLGGADHHTDPGRYWNWTLYLKLVRRFAYPAPPIAVASSTLYAGQTVTGKVPWHAAVKGPVQQVDFLVDGRPLWVAHAQPFAFGVHGTWNTLELPNGTHTLGLVAHGPYGATAKRTLTVRVRNRAFRVTTSGIRRGQVVKALLRFDTAAVGTPLDSARVYVDGRLLAADAKAPYRFALDTHRLVDGVHTLDVRMLAFDGRTAWKRLRVVVRNAKPKPKPAPRPALPKPIVVGQSIAEGQTLTAPTSWQVFVKKPAERVDFLVDGVVVGSTTAIPYGFSLDPASVPAGTHTLVARVVGAGGTVQTAPLSVTVAAPAALTGTAAEVTTTTP
jgi:N-acetyl-anhydromuramyl-L-alanine amidase AmpD